MLKTTTNTLVTQTIERILVNSVFIYGIWIRRPGRLSDDEIIDFRYLFNIWNYIFIQGQWVPNVRACLERIRGETWIQDSKKTVPKIRKTTKYRKCGDSYLNIGFTPIEINGNERPQCVIDMKILASKRRLPSKLKRLLETVNWNIYASQFQLISGQLSSAKNCSTVSFVNIPRKIIESVVF